MKRGLKADLLEEVLNFLVQEKELPVRYRDHQLTNSKHFQGVRECHIHAQAVENLLSLLLDLTVQADTHTSL